VGLVLRGGEAEEEADGVATRILPADPAGYAHLLFAALHALDEAGVAEIVVEAAPADDAWLAIRDRLERASR
jgi:L-threonylcarbamoyladenylate synthase